MQIKKLCEELRELSTKLSYNSYYEDSVKRVLHIVDLLENKALKLYHLYERLDFIQNRWDLDLVESEEYPNLNESEDFLALEKKVVLEIASIESELPESLVDSVKQKYNQDVYDASKFSEEDKKILGLD